MKKNKQKKLPIIKKLNTIYKKGYLPSRKQQSYKLYVERSGFVTFSDMINCFAHACFNLRNEHIKNYKISQKETSIFWELGPHKTAKETFEVISEFVKQTGLNIQETTESKKVKPYQWKVAFYFEDTTKDIHFVLQEKEGVWSSKSGSIPTIKLYRELPYVINNSYELVGVYVITNPYLKNPNYQQSKERKEKFQNSKNVENKEKSM